MVEVNAADRIWWKCACGRGWARVESRTMIRGPCLGLLRWTGIDYARTLERGDANKTCPILFVADAGALSPSSATSAGYGVSRVPGLGLGWRELMPARPRVAKIACDTVKKEGMLPAAAFTSAIGRAAGWAWQPLAFFEFGPYIHVSSFLSVVWTFSEREETVGFVPLVACLPKK